MDTTHAASLEEHHRFWLEHIQRCTEQGQSMANYAKSRGLKITALYYWNKKLRALGRLPREESKAQFTAVELALPREVMGRYRLCFPNGLILEWDKRADSADLGAVIGVVQQPR